MFYRAEGLLKAKQWIMDIENPLKAVRIPKENQVEVVFIQLTDMARTWWLAKEVRHQEPLTLWRHFMPSFSMRWQNGR